MRLAILKSAGDFPLFQTGLSDWKKSRQGQRQRRMRYFSACFGRYTPYLYMIWILNMIWIWT